MTYIIIIKHVKFSYSLTELNYYFVHQPVATNSMHLQSTYTPTLHLSYRRCIWNPVKQLRKRFRGNS